MAAAGIDVSLVEKNPWLGGRVCQIHRLFQSEGWPSVCDASCVGPVQAKGAILDDNISIRTQTVVTNVSKESGTFSVTFESDPTFVDADSCISCGECSKICPEETYRRFDNGRSMRKAIDKEFERALPDTYAILPDACTLCGECVSVCPSNAITLDATTEKTTESFGAVFLATGFDQTDPEEISEYQSAHPDVVTSLEFERLMDEGLVRPSNGDEPESIVFVQCAGSRAGPDKETGGVEYCSKTCCSVTTKQVDRLLTSHPMIEPMVVYYRDMRTYERALESLYQKVKNAGVEFINGEVTEIGRNNGGLKLEVTPIANDENEDEPDPIAIDADLVVLATGSRPTEGSSDLYNMFGVTVDRYGYPIENQPRLFRPTESLVDRVYVIGASSGSKVVQHASEQGSAAAMRALPALMKGETLPPRYASRVNPDICIRCGLCQTMCPHGAISMTIEGAVSDPAFCQSCGFCAATCPVGAAALDNFTNQQLLAQTEVAFRNLPPGQPKILALLCYWCSYSAADFAGVEHATAPPNYRAIRIRCSSSVNTAVLMQMFRMGVDGILLAGCPERSCHHLHGNFVTDKRIDLARAVMGQLGLDQARLRFEYIGAPMQGKLLETLEAMNIKLRTLGPNPAAVSVTDGDTNDD